MNLDALSKQLQNLRVKAETIPDQEIGDTLREEAGISLNAKFAIYLDTTLTPEEKRVRCQAIDQQMEASKSAERKAQERRYWLRYPVTGIKEQILSRLTSYQESTL